MKDRNMFLMIKAALLLALIQMGICLLPLHRLRQLLTRFSGHPERSSLVANPGTARLVRVVETTGRFIPGVRCLAKALAIQTLLRRRGRQTHLRIGFSRNDDEQLLVHAWLEENSKPHTGEDTSKFRSIPISLVR